MEAIEEVEAKCQQESNRYQDCGGIQAEESPDSMSFELCALHNYGFDYIGSVFSFVRCSFQDFVQLFLLN